MQIIYRDEEFPDGYYPLEGAFNDNGCEAYTGPTFNYFLAKDSATNYVIKLDYGCLLLFAKVKMINTNNRGGYLR